MSKKAIEFTYKDKDYRLEFTADSLANAEKRGYSFDNFEGRMLTGHIDLFCAAFECNHANTPNELRVEICGQLEGAGEDGEGVFTALADMFAEAVNSITRPSGNIKWKLIQ